MVAAFLTESAECMGSRYFEQNWGLFIWRREAWRYQWQFCGCLKCWASVATFEVNSGLCELTVIIAMSLLHIWWYIWFSSGFSDKNEKFNLYDVIIFNAHWVMCMSFFRTISVLLCPVIPHSHHWFLSGQQIQVSFFYCWNYTMWTKNALGDLMSPVMFVLSFSVSGVMAVRGGNSQCVASESTFSKVALLGTLKARSHYFPYCLTLLHF